jgi:hypothetical protein
MNKTLKGGLVQFFFGACFTLGGLAVSWAVNKIQQLTCKEENENAEKKED